jgi:hypothetical protein
MYFERACKNSYQLVSDKGDVLIADLDNYEERPLLIEFRKNNPDLPVILLSVRDTKIIDIDNATVLKKPIDLKLLKTTLDLISSKIPLNKKPEPREQIISSFPIEVAERRKKNIEWKKTERRKSYAAALSTETTTGVIEKNQKEKQALGAALKMDKYVNRSYIGSNKDIDPFDPEAVKKISFKQDNFLHGHLYRLSREVNLKKENSRIMKLTTDNGVFVISSDGRSLKSTINEAKLRVISGVPIAWDKSTISLLVQNWDNIPGEIFNTEETLWKTSIWASRGRIPSGTSLETPVSLRFWPNLTRLLLFPHAIRIAAVWCQRPMSLIDTAIYLGIPQRYVFSFFSATQAIGASYNLKSSSTPEEAVQAISREKSNNRGLFSRILKHIKRTT